MNFTSPTPDSRAELSETGATPIPRQRRRRWLVVALFAIAMAYLEAAVVLDLRTIHGELDPFLPVATPMPLHLAKAEVVREAATLIMLATTGWLAGWCSRSRFGFWLTAFGLWDIFYYLFLVPLTGWPKSLFDWDILFLIPLPWWGPVLAPCLIAALMAAFGTLVTLAPDAANPPWPRGPSIAVCGAGILLALYVFMADALAVTGHPLTILPDLRPTAFPWPLFLVAVALMAVPVLGVAVQFRAQLRRPANAAGMSTAEGGT
jgi:hypothetical protein